MAKTSKQADREKITAAQNADLVIVRITKMGDGKVSTGEHLSGEGDLLYEYGETPRLPRVVAEALEDAGYGEIQNERTPRAPKTVVETVEEPLPPEALD